MRRNRESQFQPVMRRNGVTANVIRMNRSDQLPKRSIISSIGFAPNRPVISNASPTTSANGNRQAAKTSGFQISRICLSVSKRRLEVTPEVQAFVEIRDLFAVPVEHQSGLFAGEYAGTDPPFPCLAPAWVVDLGVHVGVETVLVRLRHVPAGFRASFAKANLYNALDALEAVFPRHNQPDRCAILVGQYFAVQSYGKNGQWVGCFLDCQPFAIRPLENTSANARHALGIVERFKGKVLCFGCGLQVPDDIGERDPDPRYDH